MELFSPARSTLLWRPVTLDEREPYLRAASAAGSPSADYTFGNLYLWNETYHQSLAYVGDHALIRVTEDGAHFRYLFPIGAKDPSSAIELLFAEAKAAGQRLSIVGATEAQLASLPPALLDRFTVTETRDHADYLYRAESLATRAGRTLHGTRNHINAFSAAHDWQLKPLTPADFDACRDILAAWEANAELANIAERRAILRALDAFAELSLFGALLTVEGRPVAFTVGEMIGEDILCVHFEKTLPDFRSAYPVINREFVRMVREQHPALSLVNREDDMGLDNLRAAKLSYLPELLLRKFALQAKDL